MAAFLREAARWQGKKAAIVICGRNVSPEVLRKIMLRAIGIWLLASLAAPAAGPLWAADGKPLFNGKNLDGWEVIGDGQWTVMADGTVLGQRIGDLRKQFVPGGPMAHAAAFKGWVDTQSWLYTKRNDFGEFDLHLEYWTKTTGNSGVSIRDTSRAKWGVITPPDYTKTPSKIGYEIQINNRFPDPHPSGSIYGFMDAPKDAQRDDDWNAMDIISRNEKITIKLNGRVVAEHAGDPQRSKSGPDRSAAARSVLDHHVPQRADQGVRKIGRRACLTPAGREAFPGRFGRGIVGGDDQDRVVAGDCADHFGPLLVIQRDGDGVGVTGRRLENHLVLRAQHVAQEFGGEQRELRARHPPAPSLYSLPAS